MRTLPHTMLTILVLAGATLSPMTAHAATTDAQLIEALQTELDALRARLDRLESDRKVPEVAYQVPATGTAPAAASWTEQIRLKGDFRYRHETIDAESASKRHRQRIRARPAIIADLSDELEVGFGIATGSDDPISTNQTLGDGFSSKSVALDLAYFSWDTPVEGLNWTAGKFKNPLHRTGDNGLLWDSDLRPEGTNLTYKNGPFSATALGLWASESSGDDTFVLGGQGMWKAEIGSDTQLLVGAGYYDFSDTKGRPVLYDGDPRGNSVDAAGNYLYGYEELEIFTELSLNIADIPTRLFANYVQNLDADDYDTGYAVGGTMMFGQGSRPWDLTYIYQDLEADAVLGLFTDSDFIGGGTDGTGHIFRGSYGLTRNVSLGGTLFINERGGNLGTKEDYNRLQLDVEFKY